MRYCVQAILFAVLAGLLTGCRLIILGTVVTAATVTGAGYVVYKAGEQVVVTTGNVAGGTYKAGEHVVVATGKAAGSAADGAQELIFFNNELKTSCPADVPRTYLAACNTLNDLGFTKIQGRVDALSGQLEAVTVEKKNIVIALRHKSPTQTSIRIKVGIRGDLDISKMIYDRILENL